MHKLLEVLSLLFEFFDAHNIPFDLVVDDFDRRVSNLVLENYKEPFTYRDQEGVELAEVAVSPLRDA